MDLFLPFKAARCDFIRKFSKLREPPHKRANREYDPVRPAAQPYSKRR